MRVAETLDRRVVVAVARGVIVAVADLAGRVGVGRQLDHAEGRGRAGEGVALGAGPDHRIDEGERSEEHTSELQSLMRMSYAVFCLKKKKNSDYNVVF